MKKTEINPYTVSRKDIVDYAAKEKMVEKAVDLFRAYEAVNNPYYEVDLQDLAQDIYLYLLNMPAEKIGKIYLDGKLKYFIFIMVKQNVQSNNSRYYYAYKKFIKECTQIEDYEKAINNDDEEYYEP